MKRDSVNNKINADKEGMENLRKKIEDGSRSVWTMQDCKILRTKKGKRRTQDPKYDHGKGGCVKWTQLQKEDFGCVKRTCHRKRGLVIQTLQPNYSRRREDTYLRCCFQIDTITKTSTHV